MEVTRYMNFYNKNKSQPYPIHYWMRPLSGGRRLVYYSHADQTGWERRA